MTAADGNESDLSTSVSATPVLCQNDNGDVNTDSAIKVLDVIAVVNYILDSEGSSFDDCELAAADLNNDTIVNVIDIIAIVNVILDENDVREEIDDGVN